MRLRDGNCIITLAENPSQAVELAKPLGGSSPYFHNGSAATLEDAVEFYNSRFKLNLSAQEKGDLVAFLKTL